MLRLQAFKFALRPNGEQLRNLRQFAGSCRFVYNKGLALNLGRYEKKEQRLGYAGLCALLPNWKMEHQFLSRYQRKRCRTWNERTPTSFKNELTFRSSRRKASVRVSEFRKASRSTTGTDVSKSRRWAGCATASRRMCLVKRRTSLSANPVASGSCPSKPSGRSQRRSVRLRAVAISSVHGGEELKQLRPLMA